MSPTLSHGTGHLPVLCLSTPTPAQSTCTPRRQGPPCGRPHWPTPNRSGSFTPLPGRWFQSIAQESSTSHHVRATWSPQPSKQDRPVHGSVCLPRGLSVSQGVCVLRALRSGIERAEQVARGDPPGLRDSALHRALRAGVWGGGTDRLRMAAQFRRGRRVSEPAAVGSGGQAPKGGVASSALSRDKRVGGQGDGTLRRRRGPTR